MFVRSFRNFVVLHWIWCRELQFGIPSCVYLFFGLFTLDLVKVVCNVWLHCHHWNWRADRWSIFSLVLQSSWCLCVAPASQCMHTIMIVIRSKRKLSPNMISWCRDLCKMWPVTSLACRVRLLRFSSLNQSRHAFDSLSVPPVSGIFISCVFSASLSTVSAISHSISGIVYNDYIRPRKWFAHTDFNANLTMRFIIICLGTICALAGVVVERFDSIFQISMTIAGTFIGATFGVFTLGMLYPWANKKGVLVGTIVSVATMMVLTFNSMYHSSKLHYEPLPMSTEGCSQEILDHLHNM